MYFYVLPAELEMMKRSTRTEWKLQRQITLANQHNQLNIIL